MRRVVTVLLLVVLGAGGYALALFAGWLGSHRGPGEPTAVARPAALTAGSQAGPQAAASQLGAKQLGAKRILFGDLHVHTTFSTDAFLMSLPMVQGEGAHPPADACDFARFCSGLDFWSINDHAEALSPRRWQETVDSVRQCNAIAGDPARPDVVAFLGWEWTQVGATPAEHWGHKNVVLRGLADDEIPTRPIAAGGLAVTALRQVPLRSRLGPALFDFGNRQSYFDFDRFVRELLAVSYCPQGVDARALPADCQEVADTPATLFEKLDQWGHDAMVIPHGTTWGMYTPPGADWRKQLGAQHDPARQMLFEVFSGHGNSEEYRELRAVTLEKDGSVSCPAPSAAYEPSCWRAGEILRARCAAAGRDAAACEAIAERTRQLHAEAGVAGHRVVQGESFEEWLDAGQCRDCFLPAFNYRPRGSAQYVLALRNFSGDGGAERFRFGFLASSDNHTARPGTGYKEFARGSMSDRRGPRDARWARRLAGPDEAAGIEPLPFDRETTSLRGFQLVEFERQTSFFLTGGLVAVHAEARERDAIWEALERREVYGTSGGHMLLWFDLLNAPGGGTAPMGSAVGLAETPRFRVRAAGAFEQLPGCPDWSERALAPGEIERLCRGECYHPSDERRRIARIEVVRIRPQWTEAEDPGVLIEDPWRRFPCPPDRAGCRVEFEDPEFAEAGREAVYYARAIEEPKLGINAASLRCRRDETGACLEVEPCYGDYRTAPDDDCLAPHEPRAWSSPIYLDPER